MSASGVLVVGMHRSGTSVATRLVSLLGASVCAPEHLVRSHDGNPGGHWECAPLVAVDEALLHATASRWWCPPGSPDQMAGLAEDRGRAARALEVLTSCHPRRPWVWKDPRLGLTLPFWRRAGLDDVAVVWVLRHPLEVAASLHRRDGIDPLFGHALWERYTELTAEAVDGLPTLRTTYDALQRDPVDWAAGVARFVAGAGVPAQLPADVSGIEACVDRRAPAAGERREHDLTPRQRALWRAATGTGRLPARVRGGTRSLMDEVRAAFRLVEPEPHAVAGFMSSTGVRVTRPRPPRWPSSHGVSVLLAPAGRPATLAAAAALRPRLPADAEVLTIVDPDAASPPDDVPGWFVPIRAATPGMPLAARLNLAAERAQGSILIVLAGPPVTPQPGWLPALRRALDRPQRAVAVPALVPSADGDAGAALGLEVDRLLLDTPWGQGRTADPFQVAAGSLAAMAVRREAFEAVGGFDTGLRTSGEDVDLCLRLRRCGWEIWAVPGARVDMRFETLPADHLDVLTDTLRLGAVHLGPDMLCEQLRSLVGVPGLSTALARVAAGDTGHRRCQVDAVSWFTLDELPAVDTDPQLTTDDSTPRQARLTTSGAAGVPA